MSKKHIDFHGNKFDQIEAIIDDNLEKLYEYCNHMEESKAEDEPLYASFITLDIELDKYCTDVSNKIEYNDAKGMQQAILGWIKGMVTPELLEHVSNGNIKNLSVLIGPNTLSGRNLNEDYYDGCL